MSDSSTDERITSSPQHIVRKFGLGTGVFSVFAAMVGVGILTAPGQMLQMVNDPGTLITVWLLVGLVSICGALILGEMGTAYPEAGGEYVFVKRALGDAPAFVYGWGTVFVGFVAPIALTVLLAADYLFVPFQTFVDPADPDSSKLLFGVPYEIASRIFCTIVLLMLATPHCLGHFHSGLLQSATTIFKIGTLIVFILAGLFWGKGSWENWSHTVSGDVKPFDWAMFAGAFVWAKFSFLGWNAVLYLGGEIKNPGRNIPLASIGGALTVLVLYLATIAVYFFAIDPAALNGYSEESVGAIAQLATTNMFGKSIAIPVSIVIGVGILASISLYLLVAPRVIFALSNDGFFLAFGGRVHPKSDTPVNATLLVCFSSIVLLWLSNLAQLLETATIGLMLMGTLGIVSIFVFRKRPDYKPAFKVPVFWIPAAIYMTISFLAVYMNYRRVPVNTIIGCSSILIGFPLYYICKYFGWIRESANDRIDR